MSDEGQKPPSSDAIPATVGDRHSGLFTIQRKGNLGAGNFGSVFCGVSVNNPSLEVAVKFETAHCGTYAKREWALMKSLKGVSVPRIYYTGVVGDMHVMVMDRLGHSLQQVCDARPVRVLSVSETRALGMKALSLLQGLHEQGVVHGDVKPENFLLGHKPLAVAATPAAAARKAPARAAAAAVAAPATARGAPKRRRTREESEDGSAFAALEPADAEDDEDGAAAAAAAPADDGAEPGSLAALAAMDLEHLINKYGLFCVDLGLGLTWTQKELYTDVVTGHCAYKQRIDHFSGTVRYASVNVHVGRYSTRRDDLESLLYVLIFLHRGSLPWQGFTGNGKEMLVCRKKGSMSIADICRGCPEEIKYLLAYVRELRYDSEPDYAYMMTLMEFGKGRLVVKKWLAEDEKDKTPGAPPALPTSPAGAPVNPANKRKRDGEASPIGAGAGSPFSLVQSGASTGASTGPVLAASGTRPQVVVPKTDEGKCWIIVNTSSEGEFRRPSGQTVTMHTCWENLVKKIKEFWDADKKVSQICFDGGMWSGIFDDEGTGYNEQTVHHSPGKEFPGEWVRVKWEEGYMVTSVAASDAGWGIVASKMARKRAYEQQSYMATSTFPAKWIAEKWASGFMVTSVACYKSPRPFWVVVMSSGTRFSDQIVELDYKYPSESVRARWGDGLMITSHAASCDQIVFVMSRYAGSDAERQHCIRAPTGPIAKVEEDWKDGLYLTGLAYGRVV